MSGTPYDRTDGGTLRLIASFGEKVADVGYKELVEAGILPRAKIIFDKITGPILPKKPKLTYAQVYKQGVVESDTITQHVVDWTRICVAQGLAVMILVDQIEHGKLLDEALWLSAGELIPHAFIHGNSSNRDEALQEFKDKEISVLIASSILDTGISIDGIDVLIPVGSRKSKIRTLQKLGRALRGEKAIVIEFFNMTHKFLMDHSQIRFRDYSAENCFLLKQSAPNADLIKRLWEMP
jgi:superfamily II DNA or RNA helicase